MDVPRKPIPFLTPSEGRNVGVAFVVGAILTALAPLPLPLKVPALLVTCLIGLVMFVSNRDTDSRGRRRPEGALIRQSGGVSRLGRIKTRNRGLVIDQTDGDLTIQELDDDALEGHETHEDQKRQA